MKEYSISWKNDNGENEVIEFDIEDYETACKLVEEYAIAFKCSKSRFEIIEAKQEQE